MIQAPTRIKSRQTIESIIKNCTSTAKEKCEAIEAIVKIDPDCRSNVYIHGKTAMHLAVEFNLPRIINTLAKLHFPINTPNKVHKTPLHIAAQLNLTEAMLALTFFLTSQELNILDENDESALHHAVRGKSYQCVKILMSKGIDATLKNKLNQTAHDLITGTTQEKKRITEALYSLPYPITKELESAIFFPPDVSLKEARAINLQKEFQTLLLAPNLLENKIGTAPNYPQSLPVTRRLSSPRKKDCKSPISLTEEHFINQDLISVTNFLANQGDPNFILEPDHLPLIYYAFIYQSQQIFIELILAGATLSNDNLVTQIKKYCLIQDNSCVQFLRSIESELMNQSIEDTIAYEAQIEFLSSQINTQLLQQRLTQDFKLEDISILQKKTSQIIQEKTGCSAAIVNDIYNLVSGTSEHEKYHFDVHHINTSILGLLSHISPDQYLRAISILANEFSNIQKLIALYSLKQMFIVNRDFGHTYNYKFKKFLKSFLKNYYLDDLSNLLLRLFKITSEHQSHSRTKAYLEVSNIIRTLPAYQSNSLEQKLDRLPLNVKSETITKMAKLVSAEICSITLYFIQQTPLKHYDLTEKGLSSTSQGLLATNLQEYLETLNALSDFIEKTINRGQNITIRSHLFKVFAQSANLCLQSCEQHAPDFNAMISILGGLNRCKHLKLELDKKTKKIISQLQELTNPTQNSRHMRLLSELHPQALPLLGLFQTDRIQASTSHDFVFYKTGLCFKNILKARHFALTKLVPYPKTSLSQELKNKAQSSQLDKLFQSLSLEQSASQDETSSNLSSSHSSFYGYSFPMNKTQTKKRRQSKKEKIKNKFQAES